MHGEERFDFQFEREVPPQQDTGITSHYASVDIEQVPCRLVHRYNESNRERIWLCVQFVPAVCCPDRDS